MPKPPELSKHLTEQVVHFMETTHAERLSKNLRNLLIEHLIVQKDGYSFDLEDLLIDILSLFELLHEIESEPKTNATVL